MSREFAGKKEQKSDQEQDQDWGSQRGNSSVQGGEVDIFLMALNRVYRIRWVTDNCVLDSENFIWFTKNRHFDGLLNHPLLFFQV